MATHKDAVFERWWPLPRSMDLVRAPIEQVARWLVSELSRTVPAEANESAWFEAASIDAFFRGVTSLTNFPTALCALPTTTEWTVLWTNDFGCAGYDSLCDNLSRLYTIDTLHWSSSDTDGPFQAGTSFTMRPGALRGEASRVVQCHRNDSKWAFFEQGQPLPGEPVSEYGRRLKRERLNEALLMRFLGTLGAAPWREAFYDFPARPFFKAWRPNPPPTIRAKSISDVVTGQRR